MVKKEEETSMFKKPQKFKGDSIMKFSSLKIPGKIKTDNDLNIRRKLNVVASPLLLITYIQHHFITVASLVMSTE